MSHSGFEVLAERIGGAGLAARGAFHVEEGDGVPPTDDGRPARTLVLVGNAGSSFWRVFTASEEYRDGLPDPLDRWSERVITGLAHEFDARPVFPFGGPPYHPFLRWAQRAEPVSPSPLGMLIHPEYGLWHAYRGALIIDRPLDGIPAQPDTASPCLSCREQPCLHACPVDAFDGRSFDVESCTRHLSGPVACREQGCLARNACPAGKPFRYVPEEHRFHLAAFLRARKPGEE